MRRPVLTFVFGALAILIVAPAISQDVRNTYIAVAAQVADGILTNAKLANMATSTIKCRTTAGTGVPEDCTGAQAAAIAGVTTNGTAAVGQLPGTTTNDDAAAGKVGESIVSDRSANATVTITIASPGVISGSHTFSGIVGFQFTTTGTLPTGLTTGTTYYTINAVPGAAFSVATTVDNAVAGTAINTSGSQSGTQTASVVIPITTGTAVDISGLRLTAGNWLVWFTVDFNPAVTAAITRADVSISTASVTRATTTPSAFSRMVPYVGNGSAAATLIAGPYNVKISGATTYYGVAFSDFTTSTQSLLGSSMRALRIR